MKLFSGPTVQAQKLGCWILAVGHSPAAPARMLSQTKEQGVWHWPELFKNNPIQPIGFLAGHRYQVAGYPYVT
jgi:hypothetical protein